MGVAFSANSVPMHMKLSLSQHKFHDYYSHEICIQPWLAECTSRVHAQQGVKTQLRLDMHSNKTPEDRQVGDYKTFPCSIRRLQRDKGDSGPFLDIGWAPAGLLITAGHRTISGQNCYLSVQMHISRKKCQQ